MKTKVTMLVALAPVALAVTPAAEAKTTYIGCAGVKSVKPRVAPRSCDTWYPWLSHAENVGILQHLRWRHWGSRRATAKGRAFYRIVANPVRIVAYRPRCSFGMCAYSRLHIKFIGGGEGTMDLPGGYALWPKCSGLVVLKGKGYEDTA